MFDFYVGKCNIKGTIMNGVNLKMSISIFGIRDGFGLWFMWSFIDPIKVFVWMNITHRQYCTEWGWFCKGDCTGTHLKTKEEILDRWKEIEEDNKVEGIPYGK